MLSIAAVGRLLSGFLEPKEVGKHLSSKAQQMDSQMNNFYYSFLIKRPLNGCLSVCSFPLFELPANPEQMWKNMTSSCLLHKSGRVTVVKLCQSWSYAGKKQISKLLLPFYSRYMEQPALAGTSKLKTGECCCSKVLLPICYC